MRLEVWRDGDAWARLPAPGFREQWERLYAACPWASVYQSYGYASTWYDVYRSRFAPLIVAAVADDGTLAGLLPLALDPTGQPLAAGGRQAEYQVWVARPADGDAFIEAALERLAAECPGRTLTLRYLPPDTPRAWLRSGRRIARRCVLVPARRGIVEITERSSEAVLRKKRNRQRLRRLERVGPLVYQRLTDPREIDALLDEMTPACDLRHGALHGVMPFADDPLKAPFHRALARVAGLLYVSALRCGDELAAAGVDFDNRGEVSLGFTALSPFLASHSPSRVHFHALARDLIPRGYRSIDLTPGDDEYKRELATRVDAVHTLQVYFSRSQFVIRTTVDTARRAAKAMVERAGVDATRLRDRLAWAGAMGSGRVRLWSDEVIDLYRFAGDAIGRPAVDQDARPMQRDRLRELVMYRPGVFADEPRDVFLRTALRRIEHGAHAFTRLDGGALIACAWVSGRPGPDDRTELRGAVRRPSDSALVHGLRGTEPWMRSGELAPAVGQLVRAAAAIPDVRQVLVAAPVGQPELRSAVLQLGGRYAGRVHWRTRVGRARVRSTFGAESESGPSLSKASAPTGNAARAARPRAEARR